MTSRTITRDTRGSYLRKIHRIVSSSWEKYRGARNRRMPRMARALTRPAMTPKTQNSRISASIVVRYTAP